MAEKKTALQQLADKILIKKEPAAKQLKEKTVHTFAEKYKTFISENKTEREIISAILEEAKNAGYTDLFKTKTLKKGGKYYWAENKNLALINYEGLEGVHALASHTDSPCLHLKPYPLTESNHLALFKSHYYGGVKKWQWVNIPLSIRGVAHTKQGKKVEFRLGDKKGDPVITIPDLLPHLARDQATKESRKAVEGEQLNPIIAATEVDDDNITEKAKLAAAKILHEEYGLREADLISAELILVPAGEARDAGLDRSMIAGYGHDDRSSVYTTMRALFDAKKNPGVTQLAVFYDKEEIGSTGKTGATNQFFNNIIEELVTLSKDSRRVSQVWRKTKVMSADVTAAINPNFADVHDPSNCSFLGYGVSLEKYGGGGGKFSTNDADAEFMHALTTLFDKKKIPWQTGELGKIDVGGGGTIAMFLAKFGADVVDLGVPVLGMHAPFELCHKFDLYSAYLAYKTVLESTF